MTTDDMTMKSHEEAVPSALVSLADQFDDVAWEDSHGQTVARVPSAIWFEFAAGVKDAGFEFCSDVTAVDWHRQREHRYEVVANVLSMNHGLRLRMVSELGRDDPTIASLTPLWLGAGFAEREVFDLFGIVFEGHPDLTRILMPDDWEGHPLRKDFGVGSVPVQFKASNKVT